MLVRLNLPDKFALHGHALIRTSCPWTAWYPIAHVMSDSELLTTDALHPSATNAFMTMDLAKPQEAQKAEFGLLRLLRLRNDESSLPAGKCTVILPYCYILYASLLRNTWKYVPARKSPESQHIPGSSRDAAVSRKRSTNDVITHFSGGHPVFKPTFDKTRERY